MDVPLATVMYCPVPSPELDDAFRTSHSADPSPNLLKCRDEPLALPGWCSPPPQSWMVLQGIQLWGVFILLTLTLALVLPTLVSQAVLAEELWLRF